jgi:hypothetical protein
MACRNVDYPDGLGGHVYVSHAFCDEFDCRKMILCVPASVNNLPIVERAQWINLESARLRARGASVPSPGAGETKE